MITPTAGYDGPRVGGEAPVAWQLRRRFFAEEIEAIAHVRTARLVDALASIPRERFLPPGPWLVAGDATGSANPYPTPDDDPKRLYHNCAVAIDPARMLFNGPPGLLATLIDALELTPGSRVLHVGAGLGYYSAIMGHIVGETGRVRAVEVDAALAAAAAVNLSDMPWVELCATSDVGGSTEPFDAILVNAGVTHPQPSWLDALAPGGRLALPLSASMDKLPSLSRGIMLLLRKESHALFSARVLMPLSIYSAIGLRDDALDRRLGEAFARTRLPKLTRLRRDPHESNAGCWLHDTAFCLSLD